MSQGGAWFIVPVPKKTAQAVVDSVFPSGTVVLADVPTANTALFPSGFDSNSHPVLVYGGYVADIRMASFEIDGDYVSGSLYVPHVRRPNSAAGTILSAPISNYLSGVNGNTIAGLIPSLVSTLVEGYSSRLGKFTPAAAACQVNSNDVLSNNVAWWGLPNPISGPGIYPEAYDFQYLKKASFTKYTERLLKTVLNQPEILAGAYLLNNTCQRNQFYYNNATSNMTPVSGNVTFGSAADGATVQMSGVLQSAVGGRFYADNEGFTGCGRNVGFNPEDCDQAAKEVDQMAL
ncbi:hypothetical protein LTR78_005507 [Recurvomyces mirabilis]|uniref:Uncharacterized protein n=1 Tax=Recurvomyces mirabilis TaxID=574656 RepID=A0AAE1C1H8_9PEZI|nr:hypothetical protein LTR78_005507 [Recurvomyces mirabilis]KAK5152584.1 hypothetical protein LTS14_008118 [Recurvomyces mirabilis]